VDIGRLGATARRVGGGRRKVSGSGPSAIPDCPRIRGCKERSRACVSGLPSRPWLSSLVACRLSKREVRPATAPAAAVPVWHANVQDPVVEAIGQKKKPDEVSGFSLRTHRNIPNSSSRAEPTTSETACGPGVGKPTFTASKGSRLKKLDDRLGTCGLQPRFDVRVNWTPSTNVRLTGRLVFSFAAKA
jgi:hypothetical protein